MNSVEYFVGKIPEIYQRIYKHPEYDNDSSRICDDREKLIIDIVKTYQKESGKARIKVLDIGCAQGYYCFKLNEIGCEVYGIDYNENNIELCSFLNSENGTDIVFQHANLTLEYAERIDDFDIIIVLNVFHHIAHTNNFDYAKRVVEELAKKTIILITELALKEEPVYWNKSLPDSYEDWLDCFSFFKIIKNFKTHLSEIERPFVFCSNAYVLCNGRLYSYDEHLNKSFRDGLELSYKKMYFNNDILLKYSRKSRRNIDHSEFIYNEFLNEISIIKNIKISFSPTLLDYEKDDNFIISIFKVKRGALLYDLIINNKVENKEKIVTDVLDNLIELEALKLYHNDIRLWNVVVTPEKAFLIDIGAIQEEEKTDCSSNWFGGASVSVFDSFMTFVHDLITEKDYSEINENGFYFIKRHYLDSSFPDNFCNFFKAAGAISSDNITYKLIKDLYVKYVQNNGEILEEDIKYNLLLNQMSKLESDYYKMRTDVFSWIKSQHNALQSQHNALQSQHNALESQHNALQSQHNALNEHLLAMYNSTSWRITAPLRWGMGVLRGIKGAVINGLKKIISLPRKIVKKVIINTGRIILKSNFLTSLSKRILAKFPSLYGRVYHLMINNGRMPVIYDQYSSNNDAGLSPRAHRIYEDLKREIEEKKKG